MRIRIRILLLIKVKGFSDNWCIDLPGLHFERLQLYAALF
jgi:hypothetical protein